MIISFDLIPLQLVYIQCVYYFYRWMFCTMPMCHQVRYQKLCPTFMRMKKEPFFPRLFSTSQKKQEPTEHGKWNLTINDQGWEGDSNSHYLRLMNTYKWCYSFCIISICIITIHILYLTHFELFQTALSQFEYFNLLSA